MIRYRVIPYKQGSRSAKALSRALGGLCLRLNNNSRFRQRPDDIVINWGNTRNSDLVMRANMNGTDLTRVSNKLHFFNIMPQEIIPPFWTNMDDIPDDAFPVVCRTVLAGHSGEGIVISNSREQLVDCPLYVKYIKKQDEYRIHVGRKEGQSNIVSVQRKARSRDVENPNWQVRNHQNGFVYVRDNVNPPEQVINVAKIALETSNIDFGAVDVIYNTYQQRAYVLEINSAPGLEGQTLVDYVNFFKGE